MAGEAEPISAGVAQALAKVGEGRGPTVRFDEARVELEWPEGVVVWVEPAEEGSELVFRLVEG